MFLIILELVFYWFVTVINEAEIHDPRGSGQLEIRRVKKPILERYRKLQVSLTTKGVLAHDCCYKKVIYMRR